MTENADVQEPEVVDVRKGKPSASGLERLVLCPGSWQAECLCPKEAESEAAKQGTRLHRAMELNDLSLCEDDVEKEACEWCRSAEDELVSRVFDGFRVSDFAEPGFSGAVHREKRLWAEDWSFSGQADVVYVFGSKVLVLDYKFGRREVTEPARNMQLAALAVLVGYEVDVDCVYAGVLQPFVSRGKPALVRYTREDLSRARDFIAKALSAAYADAPPLVPGEKQCMYCRAAAVCPATKLVLASVTLDVSQRWDVLTPVQRREWWNRWKLCKKVGEKIESLVRRDLEEGREIPGLMLSQGKQAFKVTDPAGAFNVLANELGVSGAEFTACCSVGMTGLDKLVHAKLKERDAHQTTKQSREWLRGSLSLASCGEVQCSKGSIVEGGQA